MCLSNKDILHSFVIIFQSRFLVVLEFHLPLCLHWTKTKLLESTEYVAEVPIFCTNTRR